MKYICACRTPVRALDEMEARTDVFARGEWFKGVRNYKRLLYKDVYPGVDILFRDDSRRLEFDYIIYSGADYKKIGLEFSQTTDVSLADPTGTQILYSTYIGGTGTDVPSDIGVDAFGNIYIAGATRSSDFPTINAYQQVFGGGTTCPVDRLQATGIDGRRLAYFINRESVSVDLSPPKT